MKKRMIHVNTVRATAHIPVDPTDNISLGNAAMHIKALRASLEAIGFGVVVKGLVHRVPLPPPLPPQEASEPEPVNLFAEVDPDLLENADNLDIPESLRRAAEPKAVE